MTVIVVLIAVVVHAFHYVIDQIIKWKFQPGGAAILCVLREITAYLENCIELAVLIL